MIVIREIYVIGGNGSETGRGAYLSPPTGSRGGGSEIILGHFFIVSFSMKFFKERQYEHLRLKKGLELIKTCVL